MVRQLTRREMLQATGGWLGGLALASHGFAQDSGKPLKAAIEEATKCALGCRYYAEHASSFVAPEKLDGDEVHYLPIGVVLAIMPWNFPFWQVIRFAAPALCAGNVGVLKHASNVPRCALALEALFTEAGAPAGVFQTLLVGSKAVARILEEL